MGDVPESRVTAAYLAFVIDKDLGRVTQQNVSLTIEDLRTTLNDWIEDMSNRENGGKYAIDWTLITRQDLQEEEE